MSPRTIAVALTFAPAAAFAQAPEPRPDEPLDPAAAQDPPPSWMPELSGFLQVFYRQNFDTNGDGEHRWAGFRVQRARLGVEGDIIPQLGYDVEVDPRAPQITGVLRDAFLKLRVLPNQTIRIGQQKTQFGWENRMSSTELWCVNRTEVSDSLSRGKTLRDIGLGLVGRLKLGGGFRLEDAITVVNGAGMNQQEDDTPKKDVWGRLGVRYKFGGNKLWLGLSAATGDLIETEDTPDPADDFQLDYDRVGTDVEYDGRWAFAAAELVHGWDEVVAGLGEGDAEELTGWYVLLVGKTPWSVGPLARYDVLGDEWTRWTLGAYWGMPDDAVRVLLNAEIKREDGKAQDLRTYAWLQGQF